MSSPVRVLVVDDSALMRKLIPQMLQRDAEIEVVGTAMDGSFALQKIESLRPDVVTLDLEMPRMDGMEALREITHRHHLPAIIVSAHSTEGAAATFKALSMGAFDFVAKPKDALTEPLDEVAADLIAKIKAAARSRNRVAAIPAPLPALKPNKPPRSSSQPASKVIAIGISTGGPNSLQYLLAQLPAEFPGCIVVVQHMPPGFTTSFAKRLDECCAVEVKEAASGDLLVAGRVLICPGNRHIKVRRLSTAPLAVLSDGPRVNGHRPSVDVLFRSLAEEFGAEGIAVLMTGMGEDGAQAMGVVKAAGGLTIAQDGASCVVNGMPKAAIERGYAMRTVALEMLPTTLSAHCPPWSAGRSSDASQGTALRTSADVLD